MSLLDNECIKKGILPIIFIVDTSSSMSGSKIGSVNDAMENFIMSIKNMEDAYIDMLSIKTNVLLVSNECRWMYSQMTDIKDFVWYPIEARGNFYLGKAYDKLEKCLRDDLQGVWDPIIMLLSSSNSDDNYSFSLKKLRINEVFQYSIKLAIAIGDKVNIEMLTDFTGNPQKVFKVHNIDAMKQSIKIRNSYVELPAKNSFYDYKDCTGDLALMLYVILTEKGKSFLMEPSIYNYLCDYHCFDKNKEYGFIFKTIQKDSAFQRIINTTSWETDSDWFCNLISQKTGLIYEKIKAVVNQVGLALGYCN